jgi:hypothetical protein
MRRAHPKTSAATNTARTFDNTAQLTETGSATAVDH